MFRLTSYKKITLSRNVLLFVLICCLVLVGGKVYLAHEKINTFTEAMTLFNNGEMIAAESRFRLAQLNVSITDHNQEISEKLGLLTPVREKIEQLDKGAQKASNKNDLPLLIEHYNDFQTFQAATLKSGGTEKKMLLEMIASTDIVSNFAGYFGEMKMTLFAGLNEETEMESNEEKKLFEDLHSIPVEFYENEETKNESIHQAFHTYFFGKVEKTFLNGSFKESVNETERQIKQHESFFMDPSWLRIKLDDYFLQEVKNPVENKEFAKFAKQAKEIEKHRSLLQENNKVMPYIETSIDSIIKQGDQLIASQNYEEGIKVYESINSFKDLKEPIQNAKDEWDLHEPIRVLKKLYPGVNFVNHINGRNTWGADSYIVAVSSDEIIYFGWLDKGQEMVVSTGDFYESTNSNLDISNRLSENGNPIIYFEVPSNVRKYRFIAYEVDHTNIYKVLDIDADGFTIESPTLLLVDNPDGYGEGELAYYEKDYYYGGFEFSSIKVDYIDIDIADIEDYKGEKVRFTAGLSYSDTGLPIVEIDYFYNEEKDMYDYEYVMLDFGDDNINNGYYYTFIGTFKDYRKVDIDGEVRKLPVVKVEKFE